MLIIMVITRTEIVETGIAIFIFHEAVLRAFSMTGKLHVTLLALAGKRTVFQTAELLLLLTIKHVDERMVTDIAQLILRINKVVAGINIAIVLHHSRMTAFLGISTDAGRNTHPVCQCAVENLNEDFAHILPNPFIENCTEKVAPLLRRNRCLAQRNLILVGKTCRVRPSSCRVSRSTIGVNCRN